MFPFRASTLPPAWLAAIAAAIPLMSSAPAAVADTAAKASDPGNLYFRAGLSIDWSQDTRFLDPDCSSKEPDALYGCGAGGDGAPRKQSRGDFGTMPGFELGVGYRTSPVLRVEAALAYRPSFSFEGHANFLTPGRRQEVSVDVSSVSAMLSAYLDVAELGMPRPGSFRPFIGGGIGVSRISTSDMHMEFPRTRTIVPGGRRTDFTWMLAAGLAMSVDERPTLALAWRYTDLGTVETGRGAGRVVWRDGSQEPIPLDLAETRAELRSHGLHLSVRYAF